jgi:hypothetical protein
VSAVVIQLDTSDLIIEEQPAPRPRAIKERTRVRPAEERVVEEGPKNLSGKAVTFYEQALEAQRAGDMKAAVRHVKLAITFDPSDPRFHALLSRLAR